ncbi:hypothetical protein PWT90_10922 [Aphanocladium album]|nr:hypothetical protein PWT90_10922 [Aphanocladium album]
MHGTVIQPRGEASAEAAAAAVDVTTFRFPSPTPRPTIPKPAMHGTAINSNAGDITITVVVTNKPCRPTIVHTSWSK